MISKCSAQFTSRVIIWYLKVDDLDPGAYVPIGLLSEYRKVRNRATMLRGMHCDSQPNMYVYICIYGVNIETHLPRVNLICAIQASH